MPIYTIFGSVVITKKGYARIMSGLHRNKYLHRVVWEAVAGRPLLPDQEVHHQDTVKLHNWPENLVALDHLLHTSTQEMRRCPYTGRYLSRRQAAQVFGNPKEPDDGEIPF